MKIPLQSLWPAQINQCFFIVFSKNRKIKSLTNYSPNELLRIARLKKAASLLASSDMTVAEIGYEVGFSSPSYFTKCYKEQFGESPTDFLKRKG